MRLVSPPTVDAIVAELMTRCSPTRHVEEVLVGIGGVEWKRFRISRMRRVP